MNTQQKIKELLNRGIAEVYPAKKDLEKVLLGEKKLRLYHGIDPTGKSLHLGHLIQLLKLKQFQDLGHQVIILIGDFTATVGDPSGKSKTRKPLSKEEVQRNSQTYQSQIFKILDPQKTRVVFNSEWMEKMSATQLIQLSSGYTVARMLERDDFSQRFSQGYPIRIHEFIYPLIQAYDSIVLKADIEIGGSDQKFNMILGRELQRDYDLKPQVVITMPLLEGLDGVNKMSKTLNNYIGIDEPPQEIFGKVMSISDELMMRYHELLSDISLEELGELKRDLEKGRRHPRKTKKELAIEIVARFHSREAALKASEEFETIFKQKGIPDEIEEIEIAWDKEKIWLPQLICQAKFSSSNSESKRLIKQGGVYINGKRVDDCNFELPIKNGHYLLKVGKRRFKRVSFSPKIGN